MRHVKEPLIMLLLTIYCFPSQWIKSVNLAQQTPVISHILRLRSVLDVHNSISELAEN